MKYFLGSLFLFSVLQIGTASASLFSADGLSASFCELKTVRQTVVYIDDAQMREGQTAWAVKISDKLRATLMPGEMVTVVRLSTDRGISSEVWHGCWPNYTDTQRAEIESKSYIFQASPLKELESQQAFFLRDLGLAFTKIYTVGKARPSSEARRDSHIVRALTSDDGRFAHSLVTVRVIVYSDMLEKGDLGDVYDNSRGWQSVNISSKLGSHLRHSVVYVFGVGGSSQVEGSVLENTKAFWEKALKDLGAVVQGFGADLNVSNQIPVAGYTYDVSTKYEDENLFGKMTLLVDRDGNLIDSTLGFSRLSSGALSGNFKCTGSECILDAETSSGITTYNSTSLFPCQAVKKRCLER